ncbi:MAG: hypothetical protein UW35_C0009G0011 [Candidatus Collierbacteria bacterium GW2011_GWF2_44_15]|uniref:Uncharacterized protein n=2 Tax=Candidatus Collieribacteriota TaxID=1752725 RepID=A0A0G1KFU9_9BACT|nr:MAG: hypothetical protein UW23_C0013G0014 [Candidatus Collierbacteria bacterium GW2011_GWA1_44_12]KKT46734.1 MAG: hypothetical protein UW35_C0009G0011 [Candidatus Collierbacteria bacterium GW2011_GWF2_44_15]
MNNKWFITFLLATFGLGLSGCLPAGQADIRSGATGKSTASQTVTYDRTANLDEEIVVDFRLRDYKNSPENYQSLEELESSLINLSGKASFKVKEFGNTDEADGSKAVPGMTFFYAVFEFIGDQNNPSGSSIHPSTIQQTGWDPAPQLVLVINGKSFYQNAYRSEVSKTKKIDIAFGTEVTQKTWVTDIATWIQDKDIKPELALKYITPQGETKYIKINY